ncbi:MAG: TonB-dependent receptor [Bacteroidota bacterium]|nr:TonB-dependent receptor [Bacteroidota bacterium]
MKSKNFTFPPPLRGNNFFLLLFGIFWMLSSHTVFSQTQVTGTVTDTEGMPLSGVTVMEKNTNNGVITDFDGNYSISVSDAAILVYSFVGFKQEEISFTGQSAIDVQMEEDLEALSEVVLIGYGSQKKGDVTSAVASVKAEDFIQGNVKDAAQLIQGKVAGLTISNPSGDPLDGAQVLLRGVSSINASSTPLVLVDGIPGNLQTVAPEDIASIDVLKDGSATAIYGTRGTNGVIIITTKGGDGEIVPTIDYNGYVSIQEIARKLDFLDASELRDLYSQGFEFTGANVEDFGATTDWVDEITRQPISTVHNLTFRAGNKTSNITATLNYRDNKGIFIKSDNKRYTGRIDVNHKMFNDKLNSNFQVIASEQSYYDFPNYAYRQALIRNPTEPVQNEDGTWYERDVYFYDNPVGLIEESYQDNRQRNLQFTGNFTYELFPTLKLQALYTRKGNYGIFGYYETKNHVSTTKNGIGGYASRSTNDYIGNYGQLTANYEESFGDHKFTALAGYNYEDNTYEGFSANNRNFPSDAYSYNNLGIGQGLELGEAGMSSYKNSNTLIAFFGRINYNYDDRYLLMLSLRHEGSSRFGENNKWGSFPGVSVGWRINEESFMEDADWIDILKLRGGYGVTGTNAGANYQSLASLNYDSYFLYNNRWIRELIPVRNPNPDLKWERKEEVNIGLDFSFWEGRVNGSFDYYDRTTKDALYNYNVPVPPYLYGSIVANVAEIQNSGFEALINVNPVQTEDFNWDANFTYSTNSNKLVSLSNDQFQATNDFFDAGYTGEPIQINTHRTIVGGPIGNFFGLKAVGVNDDGIFLIETPDGNVIPATESTNADRQVIGNGLPNHYASWNNQFRYKNWDLSVNLRGAFDYQVLNFARMFYENPNIAYNTLDSAYDPAYGTAVISDIQRYTSYYLEDGDFVKIDNATLGYTFDTGNIDLVQNFRIYASGLNLYTFTGYKGVDPEVNRLGFAPGNDERDTYPSTRTFTLGVNLTF